jgi:hypothetical protein
LPTRKEWLSSILFTDRNIISVLNPFGITHKHTNTEKHNKYPPIKDANWFLVHVDMWHKIEAGSGARAKNEK